MSLFIKIKKIAVVPRSKCIMRTEKIGHVGMLEICRNPKKTALKKASPTSEMQYI